MVILWALNHFLIISRTLNRLSRTYDRVDEANSEQHGAGLLVEEGGAATVANNERMRNDDGILPTRREQESTRSPEQVLSLVYYEIYSQPAELYIQSESTRTWMWLCLAILLNVIFIKVEMLLFEDMIRENPNIIGIP